MIVANIVVEILAGNCQAEDQEVQAYAKAVRARLCDLYPSARVDVEVIPASGAERAPLVNGERGSTWSDAVRRVIQYIWQSGEWRSRAA